MKDFATNQCWTPDHWPFVSYSIIILFVMVVVVPLIFYRLIVKHHPKYVAAALKAGTFPEGQSEESVASQANHCPLKILWEDYNDRVPFFLIVDICTRVVFAGVAAINDNQRTNAMGQFMVTFALLMMTGHVRPGRNYATNVNRIFMYLCLLGLSISAAMISNIFKSESLVSSLTTQEHEALLTARNIQVLFLVLPLISAPVAIMQLVGEASRDIRLGVRRGTIRLPKQLHDVLDKTYKQFGTPGLRSTSIQQFIWPIVTTNSLATMVLIVVNRVVRTN